MVVADTAWLPAWVGEVDLDAPPAGLDLDARFRGARLLCTRSGRPVAVLDVGLTDGRLSAANLTATLADVPPGVPKRGVDAPEPPVLPTATVAVCTRNRPDHVAVLLAHLRALPEPSARLLVVDNAPDDDRTRDLVLAAAADDPRLRYVREDRPGVSRARNRALREADTEVLAYVDDDVRMRPGWLDAVRTAFARAAAEGRPVACVTGPVFSGALENASQLTSEVALGWTDGFVPRRFSLAEPSGSPLFPFAPGEFGVGANSAVDVAAARRVGGFDEALGPGSPTRGGEDIEFWVRLVVAGGALAYTPEAWLWHHHRDSTDAVREQLAGYARGLGGYLGAIACHPEMRRLAVRRIPAVLGHLLRLRRRESAAGVRPRDGGLAPLPVLQGAATYLRTRKAR
jgi:GT2 family glycosyltransferase